ncbi:MAG TPA: type II toxin-antitoxin system VapC family toxin [Ensifer sp.]|nr:type II toxin-antitoxin system VapC family toxin [Ensifer sp.]
MHERAWGNEVTPDTNVLLRAFVGDDEEQQALAIEALNSAEFVVIGLQALCEFAWVLKKIYETPRADIAQLIGYVLSISNAYIDFDAVEAGLSVLRGGGDFADGVIAHEGRSQGGHVFVSFDKKAVRLLASQGHSTQLLK